MNLTPSTYEQALAYLTINGSFTGDLGLFHGRMGIILFFAHYARATQSKHYEDFAGYLLDELYEEIHEDLPVNLENGLCGIGWGIEYLVQQGFMEGDTDEILADIDRKVMELDPARMTKLDFRRGLAGIAFYVIARLNANRTTAALPFDDAYLTSLQQALERAEFTEKEEVPADLPVVFNQVLKGEKLTLSLPDCLTRSNLSLDKSFDEILLGLEEGLAGWLWYQPKKEKTQSFFTENGYSTNGNDKYIFLLEEERRSSNYGIGTYINILTKAIDYTEWQIVQICVSSGITKSLDVKRNNRITYLNIGGCFNKVNKDNFYNKYYRNIFFVLHSYFSSIPFKVLHLNVMHTEVFAILFKKYFPQDSLILTVHYTSWSFDLLGDRGKLQMALTSPKDEKDLAIVKGFESEKRLMHLCDRIIAIARHSYEDLISLYQVPQEKVTLIPHGLVDAYRPLSDEERNERRKKYGFSQNDQLLVFAGRIDPVKGVEFLIEAFVLLETQYPKLRLIIAGDGNLNTIFPLLNPIWSKVTYTGFVEKSTLYELFSISDIGILPSLHEEFGFVALEMMMMKLPIIAGKTTGLSELIYDGKSGILMPIKIEANRNDNIELLKYGIEICLGNNKDKLNEFAEEGRNNFLLQYSMTLFAKNMINLYDKEVRAI